MSKKKRIYLVEVGEEKRLVKAATTAIARNHIANEFIKVRVPSTEEAMDLALDGVGVEDAGEELTVSTPAAVGDLLETREDMEVVTVMTVEIPVGGETVIEDLPVPPYAPSEYENRQNPDDEEVDEDGVVINRPIASQAL